MAAVPGKRHLQSRGRCGLGVLRLAALKMFAFHLAERKRGAGMFGGKKRSDISLCPVECPVAPKVPGSLVTVFSLEKEAVLYGQSQAPRPPAPGTELGHEVSPQIRMLKLCAFTWWRVEASAFGG